MFRENKGKIFLGLLIILLIVGGILFKVLVLDAVNITFTEQYSGIVWGMTKEEAKSCLVHSGKTIIRDDGLVVFEIDDFGGLEGADGIGSILCGGGDGIATGVVCIFKMGTEGDGEIDEKTLDKLAKAVEKGLDKAFDKKVDKEEMRQILLEESPNEEDKIDNLLDGDINCTWLGEKTYIEVLYYKGKSLTINYSDISDEYGQYLLSVDK